MYHNKPNHIPKCREHRIESISLDYLLSFSNKSYILGSAYIVMIHRPDELCNPFNLFSNQISFYHAN